MSNQEETSKLAWEHLGIPAPRGVGGGGNKEHLGIYTQTPDSQPHRPLSYFLEAAVMQMNNYTLPINNESIYENVDNFSQKKPEGQQEDLKRPVNRDNKLHLFKTLSLLLLCAVLVIAIIFLTVYHFRALNDKQQELEELKTAYYNLTSNFSDHLESLATFQSQYEILNKSHAELLSESRKLKQCISPVIKMSQAEKTCSLCPEGWVSFHSKCYFFSTDLLDWQSSQEKCMSMCGHLVIVESAEEQNFLENKMKDFNDGGYWIGLTDQKNENTFVWVDNRPLDSNNR
ncbi:asialoglycoprotein receptor 1-like [Polypterus senegalus]|uniref:asialoglycoprotein receptor 1-like n=1 Tax=Polypterus senegalus TaxID=55291 RepID=UPI0019647463|nr:asialoglycoprotein receptor 1-like [Polypterus senegalus]